MDSKALQIVVQKIIADGPNKVVINSEGRTISSKQAWEQHRIKSDFIFIRDIRDDGWSLGAPKALKNVAYKIWRGGWTHFLVWPEMIARPIQQYIQQLRFPLITLEIRQDLANNQIQLLLIDKTNNCILDEAEPISMKELATAEKANRPLLNEWIQAYKKELEWRFLG